jgi:hypothetical protein
LQLPDLPDPTNPSSNPHLLPSKGSNRTHCQSTRIFPELSKQGFFVM